MTMGLDATVGATLLGTAIGAVAAITAGLGAAWWTQRQTARRADTDRLFQGKLDAYADLMALSSTFRAQQYHWDLADRRAAAAGGEPEQTPATVPRIDDDEFLAVAGRVRLLSSEDVAQRLDELEALLFAAQDVGEWTSEHALEAARHLSGLESAVRGDLGVR
jgi:hypothetical protein